MADYDVVHIGNYTKDTIINNGISKIVDGGGFNYGARATVSFVDKVAVITKLAKEDNHVIENLIKNRIEAFPIYCENSTNMVLDYYTDNPDERYMKITSIADSFSISDLDDIKGRAYILAPSLKGEVPFDVLKYLSASGSLIAIDAQGFIRVLNGEDIEYEEWRDANQIFPIIDILKVDIKEAEFITGIKEKYLAIKKLYDMGAKEIILTYKDGAIVYDGKNIFEERFNFNELKGRSGRGDTSISSYTAARLNKGPAEALKWAVALTSLKLEKEGPFDRSASDVEKLISKKY